jgi:hypothetical protein
MLATHGSIQNRSTYTGGQVTEYGIKYVFNVLNTHFQFKM